MPQEAREAEARGVEACSSLQSLVEPESEPESESESESDPKSDKGSPEGAAGGANPLIAKQGVSKTLQRESLRRNLSKTSDQCLH